MAIVLFRFTLKLTAPAPAPAPASLMCDETICRPILQIPEGSVAPLCMMEIEQMERVTRPSYTITSSNTLKLAHFSVAAIVVIPRTFGVLSK